MTGEEKQKKIDTIKMSTSTIDITQEECNFCTKDWTKCGSCRVMIKWLNEHRKETKNGRW